MLSSWVSLRQSRRLILFSKVSLTQKFCLQKFLNAPNLVEVKPSEFLNQARRTIRVEVTTDVELCKILMTELPQEAQTTLSIVSGCPMDKFVRCEGGLCTNCCQEILHNDGKNSSQSVLVVLICQFCSYYTTNSKI